LALFFYFHINEGPKSMRVIPEIKKDFIKTIESLSRTRHKWQAWSDFVEMAALSLAQAGNFDEEREASYMRIVDKYEPDEVQLFPKLLGMVTEALEVRYCDFMGEVFMELELGNKFKGQVFTPFPLCSLLARMTFKKELFEDGNIVTMNEPAVGGGAMVIAMCDHLMNERINFQKQLKITCQDVDYTAVCMCYIQLSLIGCNATVLHANTLSMEEWGSFQTPMARMFPIRSTHELQPTIERIVELPQQKTLTEFV
jgi:hypothetical protein